MYQWPGGIQPREIYLLHSIADGQTGTWARGYTEQLPLMGVRVSRAGLGRVRY